MSFGTLFDNSPLPTYYYRLDDILVSAGVDEWDNPLVPPLVHVYVSCFQVLKETPKGVWLDYYGTKRFVLASARKHFACPTLEQAKESFLARKARQLRILDRQMSNVKRAVEKADQAVEQFCSRMLK